MDFSRVLVTDRLAWELFGAAANERLLFSRPTSQESLPKTGGLTRQRALSLLILFDQLVLHDINDAFRLPDLEKDGIVEVMPAATMPKGVQPLDTRWRNGPLAHRGRPPRNLLQSLSLIQQFRPFVINRLLKGHQWEFFAMIAKGLRISKRQCLESFFEYSTAVAQGDQNTLRDNVFGVALPKDFLKELTDELFDFSARGEILSPPNAVLIAAILFAEELANIKSLSTTLGLGVATEHYGESFRPEPALSGVELDATTAANRFLVLRSAFVEEGGFMPRIDGMKDALALRKDPHLAAVREQLAAFHGGLIAGDRQAVLEARNEIRSARQKLKRRAHWDKALRWLAYLSVPVGVAELFSGSPPLVGTSIAAIGAAGVAGSRNIEKRNEWVLFGT
jgi:hypothetical protein